MPNRVETPAVPCKEIMAEFGKVNYSEGDLEEAKCMELPAENAKLGGSFEVDTPFSLEINIDPCQSTTPGDCEVIWNGVPTSTVDNLEVISAYLEDFSIQVGYIEDTADIGNFENPVSRNFVWRPSTSFHSKLMTSTRLEFSQLKVETTSGWYGEKKSLYEGLFFRTQSGNTQ